MGVLDLRRVIGDLKRVDGTPVPLRHEPGAGVRADGPVGRVTVAPGQIVDPDVWGNVTYDQTVEVFANAADRTRQWPNPLPGARSWLVDLQALCVYRGGAWRIPPTGYVTSFTGPPTTQSINGGMYVLQFTIPAARYARRYLVEAYASCTFTNPDTHWGCDCNLNINPGGSAYLWRTAPAVVSAVPVVGYASKLSGVTAAPVTGFVYASAVAGTFTFAANSCVVTVTDLGA
jgi:hypothetical protein